MDYYLAFAYSPIGPKKFQHLLSHFASLEDIWNVVKADLKPIAIGDVKFSKFDEFRSAYDADRIKQNLEELEVGFISQIDPLYPKDLMRLDNPPIGIFVRGDVLALSHKPAVGVVGTRKMTTYGRRMTESIVSGLVTRSCSIVSGLALGVDACAHLATLKHGGIAIAILGNGVDMPYPRENAQLYQEILKNDGAIISEYPPGTAPTRGSFPSRNRIIAAMSTLLVVPEAGDVSGSLITADCALTLGKSVYAVPGQVGTFGAQGVNKLLKSGALLCESAEDIMVEIVAKEKDPQKKFDILRFGEEERVILELLLESELSIEDISRQLSIPINKLSVTVSLLEIQGVVGRSAAKLFVKNS